TKLNVHTQDGEQSVARSTYYQAPLVADTRQQHETGEQRTSSRAGRIKQRGNPCAIHTVFDAGLNTCNDRGKQNPRQKRDWEYQGDGEEPNLLPGDVEYSCARLNHFPWKEQI